MGSILRTCSLLLLATALPSTIAAQTTDSAPTIRRLRSDKHDPKASTSKKITLVGCIFGQNGKYILMTKNSSTVELISKDDLQARVGYKVRVTGISESATASETATPALSSAQTDSITRSTGSENDSKKLNVSKMKTISKGCDMKSDKSDRSWSHILHL